MYYVLKNDEVKQNCLEYIRGLNGIHDVYIGEHESFRSKAQNSLYWKWLTIIGQDIGQGYDKDDMHHVFGMLYLEHEKRNCMGFERIKVESTRNMSVNRFSNHMRNVEKYAVESGIILPYPDYYSDIVR